MAACLYLGGRLYLEAFYWRLGVPFSILRLDFPSTLSSAFLPLLFPVAFLVLLAAFCLAATPDAKQRVSIFHPVHTAHAVLLVFGLWAWRVLDKVISGGGDRKILIWDAADVVLLGLGVAIFAVMALHANGKFRQSTLGLRESTWLQAVLFLLMTILVAYRSVAEGRWLLSPWMSSLLAAGWVIIAFSIIQDRSKRTTNETEAIAPPRHQNPGLLVFQWLAVALAFLLTCTMGGSVAGQRLAEGCEPATGIRFMSPVPAIETNRSWGLMYAGSGLLYIRELDPWGNLTIAIAETPERTYELFVRPPSRVC